MEHKIPCTLIRDMLPLYIDGLTSEETNRALEKHLQDCEECAKACETMKLGQGEDHEKAQERDRLELDFMKRIRRKNRNKVALGMLGIALFILAVLGTKVYVIGYPTDHYDLTRFEKTGNRIVCTGTFDKGMDTYKKVEWEADEDGTPNLVVYGRWASFWSQEKTFQVTLNLEEMNSAVLLQGNRVLQDGTLITQLAYDLYDAKNPYLGDISSDLEIAGILGIAQDLGPFKNQLDTAEEPFGWTFQFEEVKANTEAAQMKMKNDACVLMALIDNIGEVRWMDADGTLEGSMTEKQCSEYLGAPIKSFSESPEKVQELLDFLGIRHMEREGK